jgi:hypothetical protein
MEFAKELIKRLESKKDWLPIGKGDGYSYFVDLNDVFDVALSLEQELQFKHFNEILQKITEQQEEIKRLLENVRNN